MLWRAGSSNATLRAEVFVQKALAILAFSFSVGVPIAFGCSDKDPETEPGGGPPVDVNFDASEPVASACQSVSAVHPTPDCDLCVRARCCPEVLECDRNNDCKELRACLGPCKQGDFSCSDACRVQHDEGSRFLSAVDKCASLHCPLACGSAVISQDGG
jgi:hypothetical protein